jgi:hypothetical protein
MKLSPLSSTLIKFSTLVIILTLLTACGSSVADTPSEGVPQEDTSMESSTDDSQTEQNTTGASFDEQELPANFPEVFPLPEYAKIGSTVDMPGENSFRIFFAFPEVTLEEVLTFYQHELQDGSWSVDAEGPEVTGYGMWITHPEYEAKLDFIEDEYGIVLDLAIAPLGELVELSGSGETFGESEGLGESGGDFPSDFPVPSRFSAIDLPAKLTEEGYQLAFSFPDIAELAIIELSTALMTAEWEIGEFDVGTNGGYYLLPFTSSSTGFQGYALLTSRADIAGLDSISGSVIALHTGAME